MRLLLIILSVLSFETIAAQKAPTLEFGAEFGPGMASLRGNNIIDQYHKSKLSYSTGIFFQYNFRSFLSLHISAAYENKGSKLKGPVYDNLGNLIGIMTGHTDYHYLSFPLLAKASFGKKIKFFLLAGPYISYLLKQTSKSKIDNSLYTSTDNTQNYKRVDLGISLGAGLAIPVSPEWKFLLEARDNVGLQNVSAVPIINNGTIKTTTFTFLLGFAYTLGG
jgi:hypothetical protein